MENTFDNTTTFDNLGIAPPILKALADMGFEMPTEVQSKAIPQILSKKDTIVMSKTGSGKTAVFGVSMLQLTDPEAEGPQGLILTPTRELAVQVDSDIRQMAKHLSHKTTAVYGQHSMNTELQALNRGVTIVTGTPGRVYDHIEHGNLKTKHIHFLVLDEADRMLDMGFIDQVEKIMRAIPRDRVTLLFSATIPDEIKKICSRYMKEPETIEIESQTKTVDAIRQLYYRVERNDKRTQLNRLLMAERPESCMIFCNTRIAVDQVRSFLSRKGYACQALHGDIPQVKRMKTIQQFKQGEFHILVATDVAARGIHIEELSLVINYDVPAERDSYVHRIGRTGRAGHEGRAISIVSTDDIMSLYEIEEHIGAMIEEAELPTEAALAEHKAGIDEWKKKNEAKVIEEDQPARPRSSSYDRKRDHSRDHNRNGEHRVGERDHSTVGGRSGDRSRNSGSNSDRIAGERDRRPYNNRPSYSKDVRTGRPEHTDQMPKKPTDSGRSQGTMQRDTGNRQPNSGQTSGRPPYQNRSGNKSYQQRDNTERQQARTNRPYSTTDNKKVNSPGITQESVITDQVQKPTEKKGFLRRIIEKILGKQS